MFEKTFTVTRSLSDAMIIIATLTLLTSLVSLSEIRVINLSPLWALGITRGSLLKIEFAQFFTININNFIFCYSCWFTHMFFINKLFKCFCFWLEITVPILSCDVG